MLTPAARASARRTNTSRSAFGDVLPDADGVLRLRKGDSGPEVEDWQNNLLRLGFNLAVNGNFDNDTLTATLAFQSAHELKATGVVDTGTLQAMADDLDKMELPGSSKVPGPTVQMDPVPVSGRFPSWVWLALAALGVVVVKKKRKG